MERLGCDRSESNIGSYLQGDHEFTCRGRAPGALEFTQVVKCRQKVQKVSAKRFARLQEAAPSLIVNEYSALGNKSYAQMWTCSLYEPQAEPI